MEIIIDSTLKKRLENASANGSRIATVIVGELSKPVEEAISGTYNYFDSVRVVESRSSDYNCKVVRIDITCCNKDLTNEHFPDFGNPQAPYFSENRKRLALSTFARLFRAVESGLQDGSLNNYDFTFFDSIMRINSKITVSVSDRMTDIQEAYDHRHYSDIVDTSESTLHHSCMRHESTARNAADFYANFAGAWILTAKTEDGDICGRAIVWPKVIIESTDISLTDMLVDKELSLLERLYFTLEGVRRMMLDYAKSYGIILKKEKNTFDSTPNFEMLNQYEIANGISIPEETKFKANAHVSVPVVDWHKKGAPFCDTFYTVNYEDGELTLRNYECCYTIALLHNTNGFGSRPNTPRRICPICGEVHRNGPVCNDCEEGHEIYTILGTQYDFGWKEYRGTNYPLSCFDEDGNPNNHLKTSFAIERIFND